MFMAVIGIVDQCWLRGRDSVYVLDADGDPSTEAATFQNPDFNVRSLRGSAVLRWEYRPGATLFAVWQHARSDYVTGARYGGVGDLRSLLGLPPGNVVLVKVNYWLSR